VRETALAHAGPRLANLWPRYLLRAEADWRNDQDGLGAAVYAGALAAAGADSKLITTFLPLFGKPLDKLRDESLIFAVSSLSSALAAQGRWDEAFQLYDTALRIWSDENRAQTLNLSGNRGRLLVIKGDYAAGLAQLDVVIARAQRLGGEVNDEAVSAFHLYRACALHRLGRGKEAATSEAVVARRRVLSVRHTITLHFCRDEAAAAKQFLIDSLESEESRGHALGLVQPSDEIGAASPWAEHVRKAWTELRRDPQVRSAALRYGYILSEPANAVVREPRR
jgi:tetratricopeptide (TPR) repeat protein